MTLVALIAFFHSLFCLSSSFVRTVSCVYLRFCLLQARHLLSFRMVELRWFRCRVGLRGAISFRIQLHISSTWVAQAGARFMFSWRIAESYVAQARCVLHIEVSASMNV